MAKQDRLLIACLVFFIKSEQAKKMKTFLTTILILAAVPCFSQQMKCCDDAGCRKTANELATAISGLVIYLGDYSDDQAVNKKALDDLQHSHPDVHGKLMDAEQQLINFFRDTTFRHDQCFNDALPKNKTGVNISHWIQYLKNQLTDAKFPSTEFCKGAGWRIELNQGSSDFLSTSMQYLATARPFFYYTFTGKNECGGHLRIMAAPSYFLRNKDSYLAATGRISIRIKDLKATVFSLGNMNLFAEYNSNFKHLNYAAAGLEIELGPFGLDIAGNYNTDSKKPGYSIGIFFLNKKFKK